MKFNQYEEIFDIFNNITLDVIELGEYDDYENTYSDHKIIGSIDGDMQPYSGEMAQRDYGLSVECQHAFYCKNDDRIKEGVYLTDKSKTYQVVYAPTWDMGCAALLKEADLNDRCEQNRQEDS